MYALRSKKQPKPYLGNPHAQLRKRRLRKPTIYPKTPTKVEINQLGQRHQPQAREDP